MTVDVGRVSAKIVLEVWDFSVMGLVDESLGISRHHFLSVVLFLNDDPVAVLYYGKEPKQPGENRLLS